ncbi:cadherin repeat domain-containing protein, partial [Flavobacterium pectinovorum]|uniref:cadherin repeat domain-containing protein n=1 Tax=Flavobacterium pectinovorum TaxID=29533 RepID=UPI001FADA71D
MKKNFTLIYAMLLFLFWIKGSAQTQFWSDTFDALPTGGLRVPEENGGTTSPSASYFKLTDGSTIQQIVPFTGKQGTYFWAGEDHNAAGTGFVTSGAQGAATNSPNNELQIQWTGIPITGKTGLSFKGLIAAASTNEPWDNTNACASGVGTTNTDYIIVEYSIDGAPYSSLIRFFNRGSAANGVDKYLFEDTDGNGCGDGTQLTNVFGEFSKTIAGTGNILNLRIRVFSEGNNEEWGIDNFRLFEAPTNAAPTDLSLSATAINENVAAGSTVGILSSVDLDLGNTFTYSLVSGVGSTDNAAFTISGANLQIVASPDFETKSSYSIRVKTADQGALSFEKTFTINVNNLNEVPTDLALSATAINENVAAGSTVGILSSIDVDAANTFTYTLVAGAGSTDNSAFTISGANL